MSTNTNTNMETKNADRDFDGVRMSNTNVKPNTSMNVTLIDTSNEQTIEIMEENTDGSFNGATMDDKNVEPNRSMTVTSIKNSNEQSHKEEGIDNDMIFTSDEEDNIFDDVVQEDTLSYYDSDDDLQIVVIMTYRDKKQIPLQPINKIIKRRSWASCADNKICRHTIYTHWSRAEKITPIQRENER